MSEQETFWMLFWNLPHWEFEIFISIIFALFEGLIIWPLINSFKKHHREDHLELEEIKARLNKLENE